MQSKILDSYINVDETKSLNDLINHSVALLDRIIKLLQNNNYHRLFDDIFEVVAGCGVKTAHKDYLDYRLKRYSAVAALHRSHVTCDEEDIDWQHSSN